MGSFSIYEQPKWERIVASTQVGFRVSIWIRVWIRVSVRVRVRLGLYFGCSYIEKGPIFGLAIKLVFLNYAFLNFILFNFLSFSSKTECENCTAAEKELKKVYER